MNPGPSRTPPGSYGTRSQSEAPGRAHPLRLRLLLSRIRRGTATTRRVSRKQKGALGEWEEGQARHEKQGDFPQAVEQQQG